MKLGVSGSHLSARPNFNAEGSVEARVAYSSALTISSVIFLASPNSIIVLSR
jgi:hypothetical protein